MAAWTDEPGAEARCARDPGGNAAQQEEPDFLSRSPDVLSRFQGIRQHFSGVPPNLQFKSFLCGQDSAASLAAGSSLASTACPSSAALGGGGAAEAAAAAAAAAPAAAAAAAAALEEDCARLRAEVREADAELWAAGRAAPARPAAAPRPGAEAPAPQRAGACGAGTVQRSARQYELQARLHRRLERELREVEEQQAWEFHQSRLLSSDAARRVEQARSKVRRDLEQKQRQAEDCARALQDCTEMDSRLHHAYQQNLDHLSSTLHNLEQARQRRALDACHYRDEALEIRSKWRAERSILIRDLAHLESHLSQTALRISQYEADEEDAERMYMSNELATREIWEKVHVLRPVVEGEVRSAERAEWELAELRASLRLESQAGEEAWVREAQPELRPARRQDGVQDAVPPPHPAWRIDAPRANLTSAASSNAGGPLCRPTADPTSPCSDGSASSLLQSRSSPVHAKDVARARRAGSPHLVALQMQAMETEGRVGESMLELRQQQVILERQLQAALAEQRKMEQGQR